MERWSLLHHFLSNLLFAIASLHILAALKTIHDGFGNLVSGPSGLTGFSTVLKGTNTGGTFNLA